MIADTLMTGQNGFSARPEALQGETITVNANWKRMIPTISVLIPTYHDLPAELIKALGECTGSERIEIIVYDDGSADDTLIAETKIAIQTAFTPACFVSARENNGRSFGRNRLMDLARADWHLFLDADMLPDDDKFLARYLRAVEKLKRPALIVGGFSLQQIEPTSKTQLHYAQCAASECVPAEERNTNPGRFVFTSNVLVHRDVMTVVPFDTDFTGWGWEDVDWGLRAERRFPVLHIDNTATHMGLDTPKDLIRKYEYSGDNFWLAVSRHDEALGPTPLARSAKLLAKVPGRSILRSVSRLLALSPGWIIPLKVRTTALKLFRASVYGDAYNG